MSKSGFHKQDMGDPLLTALMDSAADGIVVIDQDANVRLFNAGAQRLFGYSADEVLGRNVNMLMPEPYHSLHDSYIHRYEQTRERRIIGIGREVRAVSKAGDEFPIDLSVGEAQLSNGTMFVGILRDLRQREQLQTQLRTERRNVRELERSLAHVHRTSTLGEMAAGIAHEINQPLAAISTYADAGQRVLGRATPDLTKLDHALQRIGEQARRAGDVVQRMRGLAQPRDTPRESHDINEIVGDLRELAILEARECEAPIRLELAENLPPVSVDSVQIQQVLLNLIRNGLEAMVMRSQAAQGLTITTRAQDNEVVVCVADSGPGVEPERVEEIFHPFQTSKPSGMGIGLSICTTIVGRHGGRLWYEPNPGGGSQFIFTLPTDTENEL